MMKIKHRYALLDRFAEGGMATIYRAVDQTTQDVVAIKLLRPDHAGDPTYLEMMQEEARIGAALHSPHIVRMLDVGHDDSGLYYLVFEWVDGLNLGDWVRAHTRAHRHTSWLLVSSIIADALAGLTVAHQHTKDGEPSPIIHRDISPENILLSASGHVKLADFGVARARDRNARPTGPGIVKGKLSYFAPEIIEGRVSTMLTDLYAMGVVLWEALAGHKLHEGSQHEVFREVSRGEVRPLTAVRRDVPEEIVAVVARALRPLPEERYPSAQDMRVELVAATRVAPFAHSDVEELAASVRAARVDFRSHLLP